MLLGILFCVCLVAANLLETKVVQIWKITATAGLVVFPISYIINDCIAEVWGFRKARLIIWMGFAMNFMVVALAQLAILMPAAPFWEGEEGFNFVFGMAPRIAVASLTAFLVGSFLNAYVMSKMKLASGGKNFSLRAITSTLVGESADSMIFFPVNTPWRNYPSRSHLMKNSPDISTAAPNPRFFSSVLHFLSFSQSGDHLSHGRSGPS